MNSIQWRSKTFDFLWMIRCPICSRKLRQTKKSAILEESRRWFIFSFIFFLPFSIILQVVYLSVLWRVQTTTDIGPWLASFLSEILARLHHMVMLSYSFCFREFWCKRLTRVVPACRAVRTAPDSALTSGGKTLLKKQKKTMCLWCLSIFPWLVIVVVKHLMRNAKGSFSFKKTFGRPSNDRNGQNNTNGAIAEEVQLPWPAIPYSNWRNNV